MTPEVPMTPDVLAANDLSVELGGLPVLRGISFRLGAGEALALLGGNGSGKTTLVRTLMGLIPVTRGEVDLFGTPLRRFRHWSRIGYVPQKSTASLSGAKVKEVVASGRLAHRTPFLPASRQDRQSVQDALAAVDLADRAGAEMAHLSGGQQQRVLIARALAGQPDLLVLDEPTAGVDLEHQEVLATLLEKLIADGTSVLVVLHEVAALAPLIDRALVLRDGRVIHDGALGTLGLGHRHGHEHEHPLHEHPLHHRVLLDGTRLNGKGER
jgi:zinc transport system ATP-binding protein